MEQNTEKSATAAPALETKKDGKRAKATPKKATSARKPAKAAAKKARRATEPREGSKSQLIIALVSRAKGASLSEIMKVAKWQAHSVRGFLSTLGKTIKVESERKGDERVYWAR